MTNFKGETVDQKIKALIDFLNNCKYKYIN